MDDRVLSEEWVAVRRRSMWALPVAVALTVALGAVVWAEGLYRSDAAFLVGVLVGVLGYWAILEAGTVVRVGRLLRAANTNQNGATGGDHPTRA